MGPCELAVTPARQSQGIGSRLHTELIKAIDLDDASLLVRPDNTGGRGLYDPSATRTRARTATSPAARSMTCCFSRSTTNSVTGPMNSAVTDRTIRGA
ncbi:GNAT superfamily N-acetyltransferase [Streptomyces aurantiacus]|uniref:GNAT family N-acetyltransferase n=1 Tax=Streptomyces aurantiacus TaxID=47760 RepID=UPI00279265AD|nr:GNAT family N-acetyltransferase [Streptomyces aurantiacus]MDQ0771561.1 GNAT superfamily N-acetyltransferase [Streptomyces aurantiacus]